MEKLILFLICFSIFFSSSVQANQELYDSATLLFGEDEFELASLEYQKILVGSGERAIKGKAAFYLGECFFQLKNYSKAKDGFIHYLKTYPNQERRAEGQFRVSECFYFLEDYAAASQAYERYIQDNPDHKYVPTALYGAGRSFLETGYFEQALFSFQKLSENYPNHKLVEGSLYYIGWVYLRGEKYSKAADAFRSFYEKFPESKLAPEALLRAADARFRDKKYRISLDIYNKVLSKGEGAFKKDARLGIAWSYYRLKEFAKAANYFMVLANDEKNANAKAENYFQAIQSFYSGKKYALALDASRKMVATCQGSPLIRDGLYWQGVIHKKIEQHEEGIKSFTRALSLKKSKVHTEEIELELGNAYLKIKQYDQAIELFKRSLKRAGAKWVPQIQYDLSRTLHLSGRTNEAIQVASQIRSDEKSTLAVLSEFSLGEFKFSEKNYLNAKDHYEKVILGGNESLKNDAIYRLGWCYKLLGQAQNALDSFQKMDLKSNENKYVREVRYIIAGLHIDLGKKGIGEIEYKKLLSPRGEFSGDSYIALAELSYKDQDFQQTIDYMQQFLRGFPGHRLMEDGLFLLAEAAYEANNIGLSLKSYAKIVSNKNSNLRENALYGRAWIYFEQNKFQNALKDLSDLMQRYPDSQFKGSVLQLKGKIYVAMNKLDLAKDAFMKGLEMSSEPEDGENILLNLAGVETDAKRYGGALKLYDEILKKYPNSSHRGRVFYEKGWLYMQMQDNSNAYTMFKTYLTSFPEGELITDVQFALGELAYGNSKYEEALQNYSSCQNDETYQDKAYYKSAWCNFKLKRYTDAAQLFGALIVNQPNSPLKIEARYREGLSYLKALELEKAAASLSKYLIEGRTDTFFSEALFNLGKVYEKLDKLDDAVDKYERYTKLFPNGTESVNSEFRLGKIFMAQKKFHQARDHFENVLKDKTHYLAIEAQYEYGESYFLENKYNEAIRMYLKTLLYKDGKRWQAASLLKVALCHKASGRNDKAKKYFEKLFQKYPGTDESKMAAEELQRI